MSELKEDVCLGGELLFGVSYPLCVSLITVNRRRVGIVEVRKPRGPRTLEVAKRTLRVRDVLPERKIII